MKFKRTKIICTIGPSTESFSSIKKLHEAGMNVARLNMSHSNHKNAKKIIDRIKKLNQSIETPVGILLDTQGPEIRTGDTSQVVNLEPGQLVSFTIRDEVDVETTSIRVHYDELIQSVNVGTLISLDNGLLNFKVLKKSKNGSIINISSTAGILGFPLRSPYAASKWAIIGVTKTLAMELGKFNIRVNAVCPGTIKGDRMKRVIKDKAKFTKVSTKVIEKDFVSMSSMKQWILEEDIGKMCSFLISDDSSKVSGQVISVDGHTERND